MTNLVAVTIGVGERHRSMAKLAAKSFTRLIKHIPLEILDSRHMERFGLKVPGHLKFRLFDAIEEADQILYFDADMVFLRPVEISIFMEEDRFFCVQDGATKPWVIADARRVGVEPSNYFNSGLFVASRKYHSSMLRIAESLSIVCEGGFNDQTQLNWASKLTNTKLEFLPATYNHMDFFREDLSETVVGHFAGIDLEWFQTQELECLYRYWMARMEKRRDSFGSSKP